MGSRVIVLHSADNVGTAMADLAPGERVDVHIGDGVRTTIVADAIPFGHKVALTAIAAGCAVLKYGSRIGLARVDIPAGGYVHVHNVESQRGRGDRAR